MKNMIIAFRVAVVTLILTGIIYPFAVTGTTQLLFPEKAGGSMIKDEKGNIIGSELIGQAFSKPSYFQPRPSSAGNGYDAANSGGSNLGPSSLKLRDRIKADTERLISENPDAQGPLPSELVMASASGLDPHISLEAAMWQVPRIAKARNIDPEIIKKIINKTVEKKELMILGEQRINVLILNMELDSANTSSSGG